MMILGADVVKVINDVDVDVDVGVDVDVDV